MKILYDRDADLQNILKKKVAIVGFGSQGHAHALNLADSGADVVVGLRDGASWKKAEATGLKVMPVADAVKQADVVMILAPDEVQPAIYQNEIAPHLKDGAFLAFGHGFNIHFGQIQPPAAINVFMVAPKGPGHLVRSEYTKGGGVPCLLAVHQDPSGETAQVGLAYASAIGGGRARRHRDEFPGRNRDRSLWGASRLVWGADLFDSSGGMRPWSKQAIPRKWRILNACTR